MIPFLPRTALCNSISMPPVKLPRVDEPELLTHAIDPYAPRWHNRPLWCVTGPTCSPNVFCCTLKDHGEWSLCIWGYSVWGGEPGFRTLGQRLRDWCRNETERWENAPRFYATQQAAIARLTELITPQCAVPWAAAGTEGDV